MKPIVRISYTPGAYLILIVAGMISPLLSLTSKQPAGYELMYGFVTNNISYTSNILFIVLLTYHVTFLLHLEGLAVPRISLSDFQLAGMVVLLLDTVLYAIIQYGLEFALFSATKVRPVVFVVFCTGNFFMLAILALIMFTSFYHHHVYITAVGTIALEIATHFFIVRPWIENVVF
ncbi:hypothetical protein [Lacticaseibacillus suihuaensis]